MEKNKKVWIGVIVVVILLIIFYLMSGSSAVAPVGQNTASTNTNPTAITPVEDTTVGSIDTGTAIPLSYKDALIKYAHAILQLNEANGGCQAAAADQKLTFKNNSYLMVENSSPVNMSVHIGSVFPINAYSFKIIKLYSATLPVTWLVDCGGAQNVSSITIQK